MFDIPIKTYRIKQNVYANIYNNGCININGIQFFGYSLKVAIKLWKKKYDN